MKRWSVNFVGVLVNAAVVFSAAFAQEPGGSVSRVVRLNRAPVNKEVLKVRLPRPMETRLANGLAVLVLERHKLPTVTFSLWVKTGALADPKDLPGLAHFTADMLREGTARRTSAQLAAEIDELGATLTAAANFGASNTAVTVSGLVENADQLLDLLGDVVLSPTFPSDELEKYKTRQLAEIEEERSSPQFLAREEFFRALYRTFPAAVVSAAPDSVKRVTADELKKFHSQYYVPGNAILGVAGDVTYDEIVGLIKKHLGDWKGRTVSPPDLSQLPPPAPAKIFLVDRPGSVQTNIVAGDYAVRRTDPDYIPLTVMNRVLGGGPSARLFLNLREEKSYTYGAYSRFNADTYAGAWYANTEVRNSVTDGAMHELMYEFKRIREQKVPETELDEARHSIVANFALSLEQPAGLLNSWLTVKYYNLPEDYWDKYPEEVSKVTEDAAQRAGKKYVDTDHLQIVCVGDGKQAGNKDGQPIKEVLKGYGPVEVFDTDGKRLE